MDASYELALAAINKLRATSAVTTILGGSTKIYDRVPEKQVNGQQVADVTSPYISMGPVTVIPDDAGCITAEEITFQIDAWSWGAGEAYSSVQVRKLADAIKRTLHRADIQLNTNALVTIEHTLTRIMRDRDGITNHAAIQFTATVETPDFNPAA